VFALSVFGYLSFALVGYQLYLFSYLCVCCRFLWLSLWLVIFVFASISLFAVSFLWSVFAISLFGYLFLLLSLCLLVSLSLLPLSLAISVC
jgi:hypothetical protein